MSHSYPGGEARASLAPSDEDTVITFHPRGINNVSPPKNSPILSEEEFVDTVEEGRVAFEPNLVDRKTQRMLNKSMGKISPQEKWENYREYVGAHFPSDEERDRVRKNLFGNTPDDRDEFDLRRLLPGDGKSFSMFRGHTQNLTLYNSRGAERTAEAGVPSEAYNYVARRQGNFPPAFECDSDSGKAPRSERIYPLEESAFAPIDERMAQIERRERIGGYFAEVDGGLYELRQFARHDKNVGRSTEYATISRSGHEAPLPSQSYPCPGSVLPSSRGGEKGRQAGPVSSKFCSGTPHPNSVSRGTQNTQFGREGVPATRLMPELTCIFHAA